jgi:hypothetical protein
VKNGTEIFINYNKPKLIQGIKSSIKPGIYENGPKCNFAESNFGYLIGKFSNYFLFFPGSEINKANPKPKSSVINPAK